MGRRSTQLAPVKTPEQDDLIWAADVFERRSGFMPYGPRIAMYVYSNDEKTLSRLRDCFGGRIIRVSSTQRWMLYGELLSTFFQTIEALVSATGTARIKMAQEALSHEAVRVRSVPKEAVLLTAITLAGGKILSAYIPVKDSSDVEIRGMVPIGPWDEDEALFSVARESTSRLDLLAHNLENAEGFVKVARATGLSAEIVQVQEKLIVQLAQGALKEE